MQTELAQSELKAKQLQKQIEKINKTKLDAIAKDFHEVGGAITSAGQMLAPLSALAAGAATGIGALGIKAASAGAEIDDLSLRLGISAEKVQEYQYVAMQAGVDFEVFNKALIKARAAILDLSTGTMNNASKALQSLGLNIADFENKEAMFDGIIDALRKYARQDICKRHTQMKYLATRLQIKCYLFLTQGQTQSINLSRNLRKSGHFQTSRLRHLQRLTIRCID